MVLNGVTMFFSGKAFIKDFKSMKLVEKMKNVAKKAADSVKADFKTFMNDNRGGVDLSFGKVNSEINPNLQKTLDGLKDAEIIYKRNPLTGKEEPYMKQYQINDDYKVVFRRDFDGFNNHDLSGNHWNFEVQTTGGRMVYDIHIYADDSGKLIPFTEDNIYIPKKSPFNNK